MSEYLIRNATVKDKQEIHNLYKSQIGREFCPWNEHYPGLHEIEFDLSREALFVMTNEEEKIIAAVSIDQDEQVENIEFWNKDLTPGGELSRLAVDINYQNKGIARKMILHGMKKLKERGYESVHFLVNKLNVKALKSYEPLGFNKVGECFMYEQPFYCYEKKL